MSEPGRKPKATFEGVPTELIKEAEHKWPLISVNIKRRVAGGRFSGLGNKMMTPQELGNVEGFLKEIGGGGMYRVEPRDPNNVLDYADPIPPFMVEVDGPPRPATPFEHTGVAGALMGGDMLSPEALAQIPSWVQPQHRAAWIAQSNPAGVAAYLGMDPPAFDPHRQRAPAPAAAFSSDQLAVKQLDELRAELAQKEARAVQRETALLAELEKSRKAVEAHKDEERALREKNERDVLKLQLDAITREMQALKAVPPPTPPKPAIAPETWVALIGALAPVLTAVVSSGTDRQNTLAVQQAKMAELQMTGLSTVMQASNSRKSDLPGIIESAVKLSPLVLPVITEFFKNKSPAAQANLFSTLMENNLTTLSTMGTFVQGMMEMQGGDPWWRPLVENAIQSVTTAAQGYTAMAAGGGGAGQVAAAPAGPPPKQMSPSMMVATSIVAHPQFPRELKNGAWVEVLTALHDKAPPENIAEFVRDELMGMRDKATLPELFAQVFETPEQSLTLLFTNLPIYRQDRAYADAVIQAIGKSVRASTVVDAEGSDAGPGDEDDEGEEDDSEPAAESIPFNINNARRPSARVPQAV